MFKTLFTLTFLLYTKHFFKCWYKYILIGCEFYNIIIFVHFLMYVPCILHSSLSTPTNALYIYIYKHTKCFIYTRVGNLIVATIYLQLIKNRYMFRSFTVLPCSHQHCVQPVASDVEVVGYLYQRLLC